MALAPKFAAHVLAAQRPPAIHTIDVYLDYVCPFSAKIFKRIYDEVVPYAAETYPGKVQFIFRHQVQPWHPSSTLTHEAGLAVERVDPSKFWSFSRLLFEKQIDFFDVNVVNEGRNQTYSRLADVAAEAGVDKTRVYDLLKVSDKPIDNAYNTGNQITDDLKVLIKATRLVGVHVSPTVIFDGVVEGSISSGWTLEQWKEWLTKSVV